VCDQVPLVVRLKYMPEPWLQQKLVVLQFWS
jgi:hypothetical protein